MSPRKFYDKREVRELTREHPRGPVGYSTLDRWSKELRETHMVIKTGQAKWSKVLYADDFVSFILSRIDSQGPPGLPSARRIGDLFKLYRRFGGDSAAIAKELSEDPIVIQFQLVQVGLEDGREDDEQE